MRTRPKRLHGRHELESWRLLVLEVVRVSQEMSDSLMAETKEFQILYWRHTDLQGK